MIAFCGVILFRSCHFHWMARVFVGEACKPPCFSPKACRIKKRRRLAALVPPFQQIILQKRKNVSTLFSVDKERPPRIFFQGGFLPLFWGSSYTGTSESLEKWCRLGDLNTRPPHYECDALPTELRRHKIDHQRRSRKHTAIFLASQADRTP
jgi:hypothetical protein